MGEQVPELVRAKRFELVDDQGRVRATLGTESLGDRSFRLYDDEGTIRIALSLMPNGSACLNLNSDKGGPALWAAVDPAQNLTGLVLHDKAKKQRIHVCVADDGPHIHVMNEDQEAVWSAPIERPGT